MRSVLFALEKVWVICSSIFRTTYTANKCLHKTKRKGFMKKGNGVTIMTMPLTENGRPDYCLGCIGEMSIRCAWCGGEITVGKPVTLYIPLDTYEVPDYAVLYEEDGCGFLVGCLRWECDPMADRAGFWMPGDNGRGMVERVPTALETLIGNPDAKTLIVHDTYDMTEAMHPHVIKRE